MSEGIPQLDDNFEPKTELYGRPTKVWDSEDGDKLLLEGTLEQICSPHSYLVSGESVECDATYDFNINDDGSIDIYGWLND